MRTVQGRETDFQVATKKCFKWIKWWRRKLATPHSHCNKQPDSVTSPPGSNMSYREGDRKRETFESTFCKFGAKRLWWICVHAECEDGAAGETSACWWVLCVLQGILFWVLKQMGANSALTPWHFSLHTLVFQPSHGALVGRFLATDSNRQSWWNWRICTGVNVRSNKWATDLKVIGWKHLSF